MSTYKLPEEIIRLSEANTWDEARLEWSLATVYFAEDPDTCLCGQYPIIELCVLSNTKNGRSAVVGNVCVKKFLGLPSDRIFAAIKKIRKNQDAALNADAIQYAYKRRWLNTWERNFYLDTWRKRDLTSSQADKRRQINKKVLLSVSRDARPSGQS